MAGAHSPSPSSASCRSLDALQKHRARLGWQMHMFIAPSPRVPSLDELICIFSARGPYCATIYVCLAEVLRFPHFRSKFFLSAVDEPTVTWQACRTSCLPQKATQLRTTRTRKCSACTARQHISKFVQPSARENSGNPFTCQ